MVIVGDTRELIIFVFNTDNQEKKKPKSRFANVRDRSDLKPVNINKNKICIIRGMQSSWCVSHNNPKSFASFFLTSGTETKPRLFSLIFCIEFYPFIVRAEIHRTFCVMLFLALFNSTLFPKFLFCTRTLLHITTTRRRKVENVFWP